MYLSSRKPAIVSPLILAGIFLAVMCTAGVSLKDWLLVYEGLGMAIFTGCVIIAHRTFGFYKGLLFLLCFVGLLYTSIKVLSSLDIYPLANFNLIGPINVSHVCAALFAISTSWLGWQSQLGLIHHRYQRRLNASLGPVVISALFSLGVCYLSNSFRLLSSHSTQLDDLGLFTSQLAGIFIGSALVRVHVLR